jgi:hypothetical protein
MATATAQLDASSNEWAIVEIVKTTKSTIHVQDAEGNLYKLPKSRVAIGPDEEPVDELSDDAEVARRDVFPEGVRETYQKGKTAEGKPYVDCGDSLAEQLRGLELTEVAELAAKVLGQRTAQGWIALYTDDRVAAGKKPLNPGMVRMNIGNRIRAAIKRQEEEAAK